jgi:hypothetical protein
MSRLNNYPFVNQNNIWDTTDNRPAENAQWDCVPASISSAIQYLTGVHVSPDEMKDQAYGESWVNSGTAASAFIGIAKNHGVNLYSKTYPTYDAMIVGIKQEIDNNHPVIFTRDDPYYSDPRATHVSVIYAYDASTLTVMDPFGGFSFNASYDEMKTHFRETTIWISAKIGEDMLDVSSPLVRDFYTQIDDNTWLNKKNNIKMYGAILKYARSTNFACRLNTTGEISYGKAVRYVICEAGIIVYDPGNELGGKPPMAISDCYMMMLDTALAKQILGFASTSNVDKTALLKNLTDASNSITSASNLLK